jgi:signal transduction histidine kinase
MSDKDAVPTILIVDDTPTNLGVVVEFLEENGFRVVVAQDGKEGLQRAAFIKPDLILLDVMMPVMDGFEVCRQLKSNIVTRDISVIFMTALADTASKLDGFKVGGVDYITKPLAIEEMLARVTTHIALRATQIKLDLQNKRLQKEASVRQMAESTLQDAHDELKSVYKRLENAKIQLLHTTKMASMGMLARGAASQIEHPLTSLKAHLLDMESCIARQLKMITAFESARADTASVGSDDLLELEQNTLQMINASKGDVARLEQFHRTLSDISGFASGWQHEHLDELLDNTIAIFSEELGNKANIVKVYGETPEIECRPAEVMQVFMNLLLNAIQATQARAESGEIRVTTGSKDGEVWVDITDNGAGIAPENINRIFDPFFSTRTDGKNVGLGLSLSQATVRKHHGHIDVTSKPDAGSTFRVWLPVRQPAAVAA